MILLDFKCTICGHIFEELVKGKESTLPCPKCSSEALAVHLSVPNFILKGTGWSRDGYTKGIVDEPADRQEQLRETRKEYNKQFD